MYRELSPHKIMPMPGTHQNISGQLKSSRFLLMQKYVPLLAAADISVIPDFCES